MEINLQEYRVLSILRDRIHFLKFSVILRKDLFETTQTRTVFDILTKYHTSRKSSGTISIGGLRVLLNSNLDPSDLPKFRGVIRRIRKVGITDEAVVDDVVKTFAKKALLRRHVLEVIDSMESGEEADLERVRQRFDEALSIGQNINVDESYDYFHDPHKRISYETSEDRVPTKLSQELDSALEGGLAAGEIGIIIAPTGVGKTLTLVNIAYGALTKGKGVVYCTLEISPRKLARRLDSRIARVPYKDLKDNPALLSERFDKFKRVGAKLQIKDYTASLCSVGDIRAYLERLRAKGFNLGLLVVDHADLMYSANKYKEHRHELSSIIAGLRRLGAELQVPVWTASQANRKALESGRTKLSDIAEDIGKANWADVAITISQTEQEKEEGVMFLKLAKTRMGKDNIRVQVFVDYDTMTVRGKAGPAEGSLKRRLRDDQDGGS